MLLPAVCLYLTCVSGVLGFGVVVSQRNTGINGYRSQIGRILSSTGDDGCKSGGADAPSFPAGVSSLSEPKCGMVGDLQGTELTAPYMTQIYKDPASGTTPVSLSEAAIVRGNILLSPKTAFSSLAPTFTLDKFFALSANCNSGKCGEDAIAANATDKMNISTIVVHPMYAAIAAAADNGGQYNFAIVKLSKNIIFSKKIRPVCIPDPDIKPPTTGKACKVAGMIAATGTSATQALATGAYQTTNVGAPRKELDVICPSRDSCPTAKQIPPFECIDSGAAATNCLSGYGHPVVYNNSGYETLVAIAARDAVVACGTSATTKRELTSIADPAVQDFLNTHVKHLVL